jgi:hypothetical protein
VVLALIGGLVGVVVNGNDDDREGNDTTAPFERDDPPATTDDTDPDDPPTTDETAPPGTEPPATPEAFQALVDDIEDFVSQQRGLPWLREVTVELAGEGDFQDRLLEDFDDDLADIELAGLNLQAFGLIDPDTDIVAAFRELLGAGVVGFYDTETDELVVRGTEASPYVRTVIAHELTHALDDQHFELNRPQLDDADDETSFAFTALVEGDAVAVETAYRSTMTAAELDQADAEEDSLGEGFDFEAIPLVLFESISAAYVLGPGLVADLLESGGQARLDGSFATPPTTSEQVLDPTSYVADEGAVAVTPPTADGAELDRSVLGAFGLAQVLGEASDILVGEAPSAAVDGWGGDASVLWTDGELACARTTFVGDTPEDTEEIADALDEWAAGADLQTTLIVSDVVTLTSCG